MNYKHSIRLQMDDTQRILAKRSLEKTGEAQKRFTKWCAREMNRYVPFDTGRLKDKMVELEADKVIYNAPYAKLQYYTNKGSGKQGINNIKKRGKNKGQAKGVRGRLWDVRMWADKGLIILEKLAKFVGGKAKK